MLINCYDICKVALRVHLKEPTQSADSSEPETWLKIKVRIKSHVCLAAFIR